MFALNLLAVLIGLAIVALIISGGGRSSWENEVDKKQRGLKDGTMTWIYDEVDGMYKIVPINEAIDGPAPRSYP